MSTKDKTKKSGERKEVDSFALKNYMLKPIFSFLNIPLHSERAIARNKIIKLVNEKFEEFESVRIDLVNQHTEKNPDGSSKTNADNSHYIMANPAAFDQEWQLLKNQEVVFDVLPSNRQYWRIAREIIKNTQEQMDFEETEVYEAILKALENI